MEDNAQSAYIPEGITMDNLPAVNKRPGRPRGKAPANAGKKGRANQVDIHVGNRLRMRRALSNISQEELAEAVGITFQQVQKYERGSNRISASRLYQFARILDVPIAFFFDQYTDTSRASGFLHAPRGMADNSQTAYTADERLYDKETVALLKVYYSIPDQKTRKDILRIMKSMADKVK